MFIDYVMRERGGALHDLGFYVPAIDDYRVALAAVPDDVVVADALATCLERSGRYEEERDRTRDDRARLADFRQN